ncbi:MAG: alpha/beta fold hydrolase [Patescibacteria group bacterium]
MQKDISIKSKDKKFRIYGTFDELVKSESLIIFVHGLTGNKNHHQFYNAAKYFTKHKYSTYRFNLYSGEKNGRSLEDCTISTHTEDLNEVVKYFKSKFKNIYLVGHSLGGPVILNANLSAISRIVLWDPSVKTKTEDDEFNWYSFNKSLNAYVASWGISYVVSKGLFKEWNNLDYDKWVENCTMPLKIVCAGDGILKGEWKNLIKKFKVEKELIVIKNAGHCFDEGDTEKELFIESLSWFKK